MDDALKKRVHNEIANATVKILLANEFQGSGAFITPDGYVLTAFHCIKDFAPPITIETRFGETFKAKLDEAKTLKHFDYDIAVLKINEKAAHYLPLGMISRRNVTDDVVATGYPAGDDPRHDKPVYLFSRISQIRADNKIQIPDAIKGRGQSGGPVYHYATKRVIGLATEGYKQEVIMDTGLATRFDPLFEKWPELEIINNKVAQTWEKRLVELDVELDEGNDNKNGGKKLSSEFLSKNPQVKRELINALFACPSMKDDQIRRTIINQLPPEISNSMSSLSHGKAHVINILDVCLKFSEGLEKLIDAIRNLDEKTEQIQVLDAFIRKL